MRIYVITGNDVTIHPKRPAKSAKGDLVITSRDGLQESKLNAKRLTAIHNTVPGVKKLTKAPDRASAIDRLWAVLEGLPGSKERSSKKEPAARADSKQAQVIVLLRRPEGATIETIAEKMGWQRHTVRGVIAGALKKRLGLTVISEKNADGARVYRISDKSEAHA